MTGPTLRFTLRRGDRADRRRACAPTLDGAPLPTGQRTVPCRRAARCELGTHRRRRLPRLPRRARRHRRARLPRQPRHLHAGPVRRPRRPRAARRRRAAPACRAPDTQRMARSCRRAGARAYGTHWEIGVLYGPHGAPDFFTDDDIDDVLRHRLGGALQLQPHRRAPDRPEAAVGAHATAARPGCIRPTSTTTPTPSARSTSPATCRSSSGPTARASAASSARPPSSQAELWKLGQLQPGDTRALRAGRRSTQAARMRRARRTRDRDARGRSAPPLTPRAGAARPIRRSCIAAPRPTNARASSIRQAGDDYLLVEYGPLVLDLDAALPRARADDAAAGDAPSPGIIDLTPGHPLAAGALRPARVCR